MRRRSGKKKRREVKGKRGNGKKGGIRGVDDKRKKI